MTLVALPYNPQPGDPEDITQITADFAAILAVLNGDIRSDNISPLAAIPYSKLALGSSIVNADVAAAAAIAASKIASGYTLAKLAQSAASAHQIAHWDGAAWSPVSGVVESSDLTVGGSDAAAIAFGSIPTDFKHLLFFWSARASAASINANLMAQLNGDGTTLYDSENLRGDGASAAASETLAVTPGTVGQMSGATAPADYAGAGVVFVPHFQSAYRKQLFGLSVLGWGTGSGQTRVRLDGTLWRGTAPITSIQFSLSAGAFIVGSRITLYGIG